MKIFQREPTLYIAAITSIVALVGTFGLHLFTPTNAAAAVVLINAIAAIINGWAVRPISPAIFTYAISAILALGATYGLNLPAETVMAINATVVPILALLTRAQVSPQETVVSTA